MSTTLNTNEDNAYYFFIAWIFIIGGAWLMTKAEGTRTILYYLIVLAIVLDLVTHADQIAAFIKPTGVLAPTTNLSANAGTNAIYQSL
jgi:hypothetical protein